MCEKIVVIFLRPIRSYYSDNKKWRKKRSKQSPEARTPSDIRSTVSHVEEVNLSDIGDHICELMSD
jgi:hypothetical protein